ncbi:MAG: hypothetical protein ACXAE3_00495 [Candidatus Kariarchaeaceae archaeon]
MAKKVQLRFHNSTGLNENEEEIAEKMGMLLLASDFIGSGRVNRATDLERISKANLTYILSKTKSGDYLAINPYSDEPLKVKLTQLPSLEALTEYVSDPSNLDLNKLYNKLQSFETKEAEIKGGFNKKQLEILIKLLQSPKGSDKSFQVLAPTRDQSAIKEDLDRVNSLVYDTKSMEKEIKERLDLIEKALKTEMDQYQAKYDERDTFWRGEIENKNELLQKRLKEREKQLEKELANLETEVDKNIDIELQKFRDGVAKNIRKDEKPIEKSIKAMEKLVGEPTSRDLIDKIEQELLKLSDFTKIFEEAVGFALRQVGQVRGAERDIMEIRELDIERLKAQAETDKEQLRQESKSKEKERDAEMKELKEDLDAVKKRYAKFKDVRDEWAADVKEGIGKQDTAMIPSSNVPSNDSGTDPGAVNLQVPAYIFQYRRDSEVVTLAIPPVQMPSSMKKPERNSFFGDHKTVHYTLTVPETEKMITDWFKGIAGELQMQSNIQALKNYLDDSADIRETFFNNSSLMIDKLKVDKKNLKAANDRLTEVFISG